MPDCKYNDEGMCDINGEKCTDNLSDDNCPEEMYTNDDISGEIEEW